MLGLARKHDFIRANVFDKFDLLDGRVTVARNENVHQRETRSVNAPTITGRNVVSRCDLHTTRRCGQANELMLRDNFVCNNFSPAVTPENEITDVKISNRQDSAIAAGNPMEHTEVPQGEESEETKAYSVAEITAMVNALKKEPTAAAVVATAAFTGLRRSELRGLKWGDLRDGQLFVSRSVWNTSERDKTKTKDSKAPVPVLPILAKRLDAYRNGFPDDAYIFAGPKAGKPLNLANLARRVIVPTLEAAGVKSWAGWHGFRRGLATNLYELGVPEPTIQAILRHADLKTTRQFYIKKQVVPKESKKAMDRLQQAFKKLEKPNRRHSRLGTTVGTRKSKKKL